MHPFDLRCEDRSNPLGLDVPRPRLSWKLAGDPPPNDRRGARQTAYQVLAAANPDDLAAGRDLLWDSGRVESAESVHVAYAGPPLGSRLRAWWQVRVWDDERLGQPSPFSAPAWWEMGLLDRHDWQAEWIGAGLVGGPRTSIPCPYLRRAFALAAPPTMARLYVTALGLYEFTINGQRLGEDVLAPGWTDYARRVRYQVYDVTNLLQRGENVLGAVLGDGWYCGHVGWFGRQQYGDRPRLLAQLEATTGSGERVTIATGDGWRATFGPLLESDLIMGESYDARLELPGWNAPGYDDRRWLPAERLADPGPRLEATAGPLVRRQETLMPAGEPVELRQHGDSRWLFDFGQNLVGRVRLKVSGPAGQTVTLRHGEVLNADGTLYTANLRTARQADHYTLRGQAPVGAGLRGAPPAGRPAPTPAPTTAPTTAPTEETYEPTFTIHGFRYVEVTGYPGRPGPGALTAIVLHSALAPAGSFECSEPLINQLQHNIVWGLKGNFVDVPTDCPQRDERLGWTGDAQVFARTAAFNRDVSGFMAKWLVDLEDAQAADGAFPPVAPMVRTVALAPDGGPAWADAGLMVPWTMYEAYGDRRLLEKHYQAMVTFVEYLAASSRDLIRCYPGYEGFAGFGDWLSIDAETPKDLIGTAFFAHGARLLSRIAAVLGKRDDAQRYLQLHHAVRRAFIERFVTPGGLAGQTQTALVLALHFDLLPVELRPLAAEALVRDIETRQRHLSTGFVGTPYLLHVLADAGQLELAYALLCQTTWPSWLYPVQQGATTIWERWDGWTAERGFQDPGMNSYNHYAYGAVGDWLYRVVAGIQSDPEQPGYRHVILRPRPGGPLTWVRASYECPYGRIHSAWRRSEGGLEWQVSLPMNTTGTAHVPAATGERVLLDGQPVEGSVVELEAGSYEFVVSGATSSLAL